MEKSLHSWSMPKVAGNRIYQKGCFNVGFSNPILTIEGTIPLENNSTRIQLLTDPAFTTSLRKVLKKQKKTPKECYLHVGLVQVGVKQLARQEFDDSIVLCVRDARFLKFRSSLLGLVESSLSDGPIYFNCFANLMVSLSDPNVVHALTVNVMSRAGDETMAGIEPLVFSYRVHYKILSRPYGERALKESPLGETKLFKANIRSNSIVSRTIKWDGVQIPATWAKDGVRNQQTQESGETGRN